MKSQIFEDTLLICDQIKTDQANYQVVVLSEIFKSQRAITKKTRIAYFGSDCPVWVVLTKKSLISKSGKFIQSTLAENTTKAQIRELIAILETKI